MLEELSLKPEPRTIIWIYEPFGNCGKSTFVKYLVHHKKAHISGWGNYGDLLYARAVEHLSSIVLYDFTRYKPANIDIKSIYSAIESIKNGCFFSPKYQSESIVTACPHLIVFSNRFPDFGALTSDRWVCLTISPLDKILYDISCPIKFRYLYHSFKAFYISLFESTTDKKGNTKPPIDVINYTLPYDHSCPKLEIAFAKFRPDESICNLLYYVSSYDLQYYYTLHTIHTSFDMFLIDVYHIDEPQFSNTKNHLLTYIKLAELTSETYLPRLKYVHHIIQTIMFKFNIPYLLPNNPHI